MKKDLLSFALKFTFSMLLLFGAHVLFLVFKELPIDYSVLITSYLVNYFLALLIVVFILYFINKIKTYVGFLFMLGSMLKFAVFFIWFYPIFKLDGKIDTFEFSIFFIPYIISLVFETKKLSTVLNDM